MKKRMAKLERENENLKKNNEDRFKLMGDRLGELNGAVKKRNKIDGNIKNLLNSERNKDSEIFTEMSVE
jgi:hypothetical protein